MIIATAGDSQTDIHFNWLIRGESSNNNREEEYSPNKANHRAPNPATKTTTQKKSVSTRKNIELETTLESSTGEEPEIPLDSERTHTPPNNYKAPSDEVTKALNIGVRRSAVKSAHMSIPVTDSMMMPLVPQLPRRNIIARDRKDSAQYPAATLGSLPPYSEMESDEV